MEEEVNKGLEEAILAHLEELIGQEEGMRERFPDFELVSALDEPMFLKLTSPCVGMSLMDAYCAIHWAELANKAVQQGMEALSRSILSGGARPRELSDSHGPAQISRDARSMSRAEREALKKRIYEARATGKKVYPGA